MCQYIEKVCVLVFRNSLSAPITDNNLITLLIMREAGLVINDNEKVHVVDPSVEDHRIYIPNFYIFSTLFLHGVL